MPSAAAVRGRGRGRGRGTRRSGSGSGKRACRGELGPDWFSEHAPAWSAALSPRLAGRAGARALFVGAHVGHCVAWSLRHLLTGPGARATVVVGARELRETAGSCVWNRGHPELMPADMGAALRRAVEGGESKKGKRESESRSESNSKSADVELLHAPSEADALLRLRTASAGGSSSTASTLYDLVYVDARSLPQVLEAAALAFPLLRPGPLGGGGVMVLTNYTHGRAHDASCPRRGIDGFLDAYASVLRVVRGGFHLMLERRARPLDLGPCRSEYFEHEEDPRPPLCKKGGSAPLDLL